MTDSDKELDEIISWFIDLIAEYREQLRKGELAPVNYNQKFNNAEKKHKQRLNALIEKKVREAEKNGVAWSVGVVDDIHEMNGRIDYDGRLDKVFKGIKNQLRDRFKEKTGVDPAPKYPVNATLQDNQLPDYCPTCKSTIDDPLHNHEEEICEK